jgi:hypothetical protein
MTGLPTRAACSSRSAVFCLALRDSAARRIIARGYTPSLTCPSYRHLPLTLHLATIVLAEAPRHTQSGSAHLVGHRQTVKMTGRPVRRRRAVSNGIKSAFHRAYKSEYDCAPSWSRSPRPGLFP